MKRDFFTYLPPQIIISILSRLPIRTIISCKCVCKSWHELLETDEFARSHLSRSVSGLAVLQYKIFELDDKLNLERHELHYNPVTNFDPTAFVSHSDSMDIQGTSNGLILLRDLAAKPEALYICNPITREYIELQSPRESAYHNTIVAYGFGVSKMTDKHKVVRILHECNPDQTTIPKSECLVYTLGTGSWGGIASGALFDYSFSTCGLFFKGNLHWLASDLDDYQWISSFDLEMELFTTLSSTPGGQPYDRLFVLGECLSLCDYNMTCADEIVIWSMKEYGSEKSWTKELVIDMPEYDFHGGGLYDVICPIKFFEDGDILIAWEDYFLFYYSTKTKTSHKIGMFEQRFPDGSISAILHTPSLLSLNSFGMEKVSSF